MKKRHTRGFTLLEVIVVVVIIALMATIIMVALSESRNRGIDASRKSQTQEILKALELYYSDNGFYPEDGTPGNSNLGDFLSDIDSSFYGTGSYLNQLPDEADNYYYCRSAAGNAALLAINTEIDSGGSNFCHITRGVAPYGCPLSNADVDATDSCAGRF